MAEPDDSHDIIIIGAGIAGASVAAELAGHARVLVLEREDRPGYHTTGRSAALFTVAYGPPVIRALSRASHDFFCNPDSRFISQPLLRQRGVLFVAHEGQAGVLEELAEELGDAVHPIGTDAALSMMPLIRPGYIAGALMDGSAADIDVDALHQHYLKTFQALGGTVRTNAGVTRLSRDGGVWTVEAGGQRFRSATIVNAAGAWADEIAVMAGVAPVGLVPKRRTAVLIDPPAGAEPDRPATWPMVVDAQEGFYLKPDAGKLLISPADETPSPPCDAQPEELDVAICVDRIEQAFDISVRRVVHKWAGLRSFVADKCPVIGHARDADGFFWLAGQGGYGIQSAPAAARAAAALVLKQPLPADILAEGVTAEALSPGRAGIGR
ncbi:FAD-dependent oxidoreductase [Zhengella mangrovi]|uniref:FAD-dependent oxidoreductase n=1 Tax=Zhengella mangrovi TaxID=1982044 RepID=A0A2G1QJI9_9HYPH|nr:FAD-dependent oxidoreductase [Zhengella mangrovi]PHP65388.1 FAD-dependent oxidoreductase [Zhengella mangrovi]